MGLDQLPQFRSQTAKQSRNFPYSTLRANWLPVFDADAETPAREFTHFVVLKKCWGSAYNRFQAKGALGWRNAIAEGCRAGWDMATRRLQVLQAGERTNPAGKPSAARGWPS